MKPFTTEQFISKILEKFPENADKFDYSFVDYKNNSSPVCIRCKLCNTDFYPIPINHSKGQGGNCACKFTSLAELKELSLSCGFTLLSEEPVCGKHKKAKLSCNKCGMSTERMLKDLRRNCKCDCIRNESYCKNTEHFLAKVPPNENYDFSEAVYKSVHFKVKVTCKRHGVFYSTPSTLYTGKGCPRCGWEKCSPFNDTIADRHKDSFSKIPSGLYVLKVGDFYKIGIAKKIEPRVKALVKQTGWVVEVIHYVVSNQYSCIKLEQELLRLLKPHAVVFNEDFRFEGHTECFSLDPDLISDLIELIDNTLTKHRKEIVGE